MQWVDSWRRAIPGDSPCGEDVSFHPEFERLQDEIEKSVSIYANTQTDWDVVFTCASGILEGVSKNIWALCYGTRATYAKGGTSWLVAALDVLNGYLESCWEDLHPLRPRRRLAAFQWLCSKFEALFADEPISMEDAETGKLRESFKRLQEFLDVYFEEEAPSVAAIIRSLPDVPSPTAPDEPGTIPSLALPPPGAQVQQSPSVLPPPGSPDTGVVLAFDILAQVNRSTAEQTRRLAAHYLSLNYLDWRGYLLNRAALWTTIPQSPPADGNGITTMRPIPRDRQTGYRSAIQAKQFASILPTLERSAAKQPYWLDGHFMVFQCLEALEATDAQDAVLSMLKYFLRLFPGVKKLKYFDSTSFASPATLEWIESQEQSGGVGDATKVPWLSSKALNTVQSPLHDEDGLLKTAIEKGGKEGFEAGLALLGSATSLRSRKAVENAILQAQYCLAMKKTKTAKQLLTEIYRQLDQWDLVDWEPELSARVITLLAVIQKGKPGKDQDEMLRRLYWLHLETALKVNPE
jgi:type VI secretion system protein VasJ